MRLRMFGYEFGSSSETYDFRYVVFIDRRQVFGGRLRYAFLKLFTEDHERRWYGFNREEFLRACEKETS